MGRFRKSSATNNEWWDGKHRYEHWYRDNTVYFITSRCRDKYPAFASEEAKAIFWERFYHYCKRFGFVPWVTSLLHNHYHTLGYLKIGENLGPMMRMFHESVSKLVNDTFPERRVPFFKTPDHKDYFDGCIRDVLQCRRAYDYTLKQAVRARLVKDWTQYPHTRMDIEVERGIKRAVQLNAFLEEVPYARYERKRRDR